MNLQRARHAQPERLALDDADEGSFVGVGVEMRAARRAGGGIDASRAVRGRRRDATCDRTPPACRARPGRRSRTAVSRHRERRILSTPVVHSRPMPTPPVMPTAPSTTSSLRWSRGTNPSHRWNPGRLNSTTSTPAARSSRRNRRVVPRTPIQSSRMRTVDAPLDRRGERRGESVADVVGAEDVALERDGGPSRFRSAPASRRTSPGRRAAGTRGCRSTRSAAAIRQRPRANDGPPSRRRGVSPDDRRQSFAEPRAGLVTLRACVTVCVPGRRPPVAGRTIISHAQDRSHREAGPRRRASRTTPGFGFAIAKALAEAGASVCVGTWPPALNIFLNLLERGKMDESRTLSSGRLADLREDLSARRRLRHVRRDPRRRPDEQALQGRRRLLDRRRGGAARSRTSATSRSTSWCTRWPTGPRSRSRCST